MPLVVLPTSGVFIPLVDAAGVGVTEFTAGLYTCPSEPTPLWMTPDSKSFRSIRSRVLIVRPAFRSSISRILATSSGAESGAGLATLPTVLSFSLSLTPGPLPPPIRNGVEPGYWRAE